MHPNTAFRSKSHSLHEELIEQVAFGMIFCETPDGPRAAHTPIALIENKKVQFHLARGNAMARHLSGNKALIVINGPDAYISARWYSDPNQVPTWNYTAVEIEGTARAMEDSKLPGLLEHLSQQNEAKIKGGQPWTMDKLSDEYLNKLLGAITGFELTISATRETQKLSQNKPDDERARLIDGLEEQGSTAIANMMRDIAR
ncbi:MAG: FMN-binding negative transcriptional regulator [Erythrobacter sp.]